MFEQYQPNVERVYNEQRKLVTGLLAEARKLMASDSKDDRKQGALLTYRAFKGLPKYDPLIKFLSQDGIKSDMEMVFNRFPRLKERIGQLAGTLSGGEQQMLAMGRALMSRPRLLLLDEPSMGLAPLLIKEIFAIIQDINKAGTTVLLVEQNANMALSIAHRAYVLETGRITLSGDAKELAASEDVRKAYLGGSVGSLLGMYLFRHKTLHLKFTLGIPLILAGQCIAAVLIMALGAK